MKNPNYLLEYFQFQTLPIKFFIVQCSYSADRENECFIYSCIYSLHHESLGKYLV